MQQFQDDIMNHKELLLEIHIKLSQQIEELEKRIVELENIVNKSLK